MYARVAGIDLDPDTPGYQRFHLRPTPSPEHGITSAQSTLDSVHGRIAVRWELADGRLRIEATVPANTAGVLQLPGYDDRELPAGTHAIELPWPAKEKR